MKGSFRSKLDIPSRKTVRNQNEGCGFGLWYGFSPLGVNFIVRKIHPLIG
jgi:hypothetical protein